jgi:hypothetical protein
MDKKKSIINIQDLGLSVACQHSVGEQPILQVIFRKLSILKRKYLFLESFLFLEKNFRILVGSRYPE